MSQADLGSSAYRDFYPLGELPPTTEVGPDENGIKTITSWKWNSEKQLVKVVRVVKVVPKETKVLTRVLERAKIVPFGLPKNGNDGVTIKSCDDIYMKKPEEEKKKEAEKSAFSSGGITCRHCGGNHLSASCPHKDSIRRVQEHELERPESTNVSAGNAYVPPSLRKKRDGETYMEEQEFTVRVSNLSIDVDDRQFRDMFNKCGMTKSCRIIKDMDTKKSRGFGFVSYLTEAEAKAAIEMYNGYALNHIILQVSVAEKRKPDSMNRMRYATGYGRALPQNVRK